MSERAAMLYGRQDRAYVTSESLTMSGFWIATGPCLEANLESPNEIAACVLAALDASISGVPNPLRGVRVDVALLEQAGVKSFGKFMKGTRAVRITAIGEQICITPTTNGGSNRGFEFKDSEALVVNDKAVLASALVKGLEAAE